MSRKHEPEFQGQPYGDRPAKKKRRGLKIAGGVAAGLLIVGGCSAALTGGEEPPADPQTSTTTSPAPEPLSEAPTAPETTTPPDGGPQYDPPAPPQRLDPLPSPSSTDYWGGLFTEEELDELFLSSVRAEPSSPSIRALDDATLLDYGRSVCPGVEAGLTFADFEFAGLDWLDAPIVAGSAVGTYCPDLIEEAADMEGSY
jgi:hypothetical protein